MSRQTLVNALLIIAGIVLAFALFAAGVIWHSRALFKTGPAPHRAGDSIQRRVRPAVTKVTKRGGAS